MGIETQRCADCRGVIKVEVDPVGGVGGPDRPENILKVVKRSCTQMEAMYQSLDLTPETTDKQVRKAYKGLTLHCRPDRNPDPEAENQLKEKSHAHQMVEEEKKQKKEDVAEKTESKTGRARIGYEELARRPTAKAQTVNQNDGGWTKVVAEWMA